MSESGDLSKMNSDDLIPNGRRSPPTPQPLELSPSTSISGDLEEGSDPFNIFKILRILDPLPFSDKTNVFVEIIELNLLTLVTKDCVPWS